MGVEKVHLYPLQTTELIRVLGSLSPLPPSQTLSPPTAQPECATSLSRHSSQTTIMPPPRLRRSVPTPPAPPSVVALASARPRSPGCQDSPSRARRLTYADVASPRRRRDTMTAAVVATSGPSPPRAPRSLSVTHGRTPVSRHRAVVTTPRQLLSTRPRCPLAPHRQQL